MEIKPLGVHVLIQPIEEATRSIVMPEQSKGTAERGIVRGIGEKVEAPLKDGDEVIFRKYAQEEFEMDGKTVYVVEEIDIMGVVCEISTK